MEKKEEKNKKEKKEKEEDKKVTEETKKQETPAAKEKRPSFRGDRGKREGGKPGRGRGGRRPEDREFDQRTIDIARVTRVTRGGKRMRFRSLVVAGNRKGKVGFGLAKGADVAISVNKSTNKAKKKMIEVPIVNETIPHEVSAKYAAAKVLLKPATRGSGIKAGGAVRVVLELAGIPNISGKILGTKNKINNVKATFLALESLTKSAGSKPVKEEKTTQAKAEQDKQENKPKN